MVSFIALECTPLNAPVHGILSRTTAVPHNFEVTLTCEKTHVLKGGSKVKCDSGSWTGSFGSCEKSKLNFIIKPLLNSVPIFEITFLGISIWIVGLEIVFSVC